MRSHVRLSRLWGRCCWTKLWTSQLGCTVVNVHHFLTEVLTFNYKNTQQKNATVLDSEPESQEWGGMQMRGNQVHIRSHGFLWNEMVVAEDRGAMRSCLHLKCETSCFLCLYEVNFNEMKHKQVQCTRKCIFIWNMKATSAVSGSQEEGFTQPLRDPFALLINGRLVKQGTQM